MKKTTCGLVLLTLLNGAAMGASDTAIVLIGGVADDANALHVGIQKSFDPTWGFLNSPKINITTQFSIGGWRGTGDYQKKENLMDFAILPTLRYFPSGKDTGSFFVEGGVGVHLLSRTQINENRRFSTAFQFGDVVGLGWKFGAQRNNELGLRFQHISNSSIKRPNSGINFAELRWATSF